MTKALQKLKLAIIAGEPSGDLLGADLITALGMHVEDPLELVGVGGDAMKAAGLKSLFDYHDLSIIGISAIVAQLPKLIMHIRRTTQAIIAAQPDVLVIIDSPAFTHRVARKIREAMPNVLIVNYVCPTVWAWKPERAPAMTGYIDHVLSVYPFEAELVARLGGPPLTYVGHRLASDTALQDVSNTQGLKRSAAQENNEDTLAPAPMCLIMPGSRRGELERLLPTFAETAHLLADRMPGVRFHIPTLPRLEAEVRSAAASWSVPVEVTATDDEKWQAFARADAALAASGTVLLELALGKIPCVSAYKLDPLAKLIMKRVTAWTAALPNLIADYPAINEYINESVRPGLIARRLERLMQETTERRQMLMEFERVRAIMRTEQPPAEISAGVIIELLAAKSAKT